jgi:hypothetical protein
LFSNTITDCSSSGGKSGTINALLQIQSDCRGKPELIIRIGPSKVNKTIAQITTPSNKIVSGCISDINGFVLKKKRLYWVITGGNQPVI